MLALALTWHVSEWKWLVCSVFDFDRQAALAICEVWREAVAILKLNMRPGRACIDRARYINRIQPAIGIIWKGVIPWGGWIVAHISSGDREASSPSALLLLLSLARFSVLSLWLTYVSVYLCLYPCGSLIYLINRCHLTFRRLTRFLKRDWRHCAVQSTLPSRMNNFCMNNFYACLSVCFVDARLYCCSAGPHLLAWREEVRRCLSVCPPPSPLPRPLQCPLRVCLPLPHPPDHHGDLQTVQERPGCCPEVWGGPPLQVRTVIQFLYTFKRFSRFDIDNREHF